MVPPEGSVVSPSRSRRVVVQKGMAHSSPVDESAILMTQIQGSYSEM